MHLLRLAKCGPTCISSIIFASCLFSNISSIPTPSPKPYPLPFEQQQREAVRKLNLTQQEFSDIATRTPFILSDPVNEFSKNFFRALAGKRENDNRNIIISPFSIHTALSMIYFGSPQNSTTNNELSNVLRLREEKSQNYLFNYLYLLKYYNDARRLYDTEVELANKIFLQDGFIPKEHFKTLLEAFYLTSTQNVKFEEAEKAVGIINQYVNKKTRGLIEDIITPRDVGSLTRLVLINAIYFKANWKYQFNKQSTSPMLYNLIGNQGSLRHEKGMQIRAAFRTSTSEKLNANILEMPYESTDFNMYIIIPKQNNLESLNHIATTYDMDEIQSSLNSSPEGQQIKVYMPAFETTYEAGLKDILANMGIHTLFNDADLTDISDESLYVSSVLHKAQVKVNEEGSEAAASTAVVVNTRSGGPSFQPIPEFRVDQPFVYIIHDRRNNLPMFIGRIINPTGKTADRQVEHTTPNHSQSLLIAQHSTQQLENRKYVEINQQEDDQEKEVNGDVRNATLEAGCDEGNQHQISENEDGVTFPCKGRDTVVIEMADDLKREEQSEKLNTFEKLVDARDE